MCLQNPPFEGVFTFYLIDLVGDHMQYLRAALLNLCFLSPSVLKDKRHETQPSVCAMYICDSVLESHWVVVQAVEPRFFMSPIEI
jgi:hypothetical protein